MTRVDVDGVQHSIAAIFDQTQLTVANHRKNCVSLYKVHVRAGEFTQAVNNGTAVKLVGERHFGDAFIDMINRVLVVKKGPATADRTVRFVGEYIKYMNEKAFAERAKATQSVSNVGTIDEDDDTLASRFVARLLTWLFQGFTAKNKVVRYRAVQLVSEMISYLGEIDEDLYSVLRNNLIDKLSDKESLVRAHAVVALSKLASTEDPNDLAPDEPTIIEVLLDVLQYDPVAEVRRAATLHTPLIAPSLPGILTRTRDTDPITRKHLYTSVLRAKLKHPRQLTIAQREKIVKDGLGDREPSVRLAAGQLISSWFDIILADGNKQGNNESWTGDDAGVMRGFVSLLQIFDVIGPGEAVAVDALLSIFTTRPNILDAFNFHGDYWNALTPESALLARVFVEHCIDTGVDARLEAAALPVVTAFAFHIQEAYNLLLEMMQEYEAIHNKDDEEGQQREERLDEDLAKAEAVLGELLRIAARLDYSDEIGRRKIFAVVRDMLAHEELPETLISHCLDVLLKISPTERELIRIVVEVIHELRDKDSHVGDARTAVFDDEFENSQASIAAREWSMRRTKQRCDMTPEEAHKTDLIDIRSLNLCIGMLERVNGSFEDNSTLEGVLADLIIPAVKRKELVMREKGLISLGLCCLISKNMAMSSFQLFLNQVQSSPEELKLRVIHVIFDLLMVYHPEFFGRSEDMAERIITFLLQILESDESHAVQAILCIGLTKLLISGIVTDPKVLISLIFSYVSPATVENAQLRQCLSYFFPVYGYSATENQKLMQSIFTTVYDLVNRVYEELEGDQTMITPCQLGLLFVDWTNPQKAVKFDQADVHAREVQMDLAIDIFKMLYDSDRKAEDQKNLCQLLGHLYIPTDMQPLTLLKLHILISHLQEQCPLDKSAEKVMERFVTKLNRAFSEELKQLDEEKYSEDSEIRELYEFVGVAVPGKRVVDEVSNTPILPAKSKASKDTRSRKSGRSAITTDNEHTSSSSDGETSLTSPTPKRNQKVRHPRTKSTASRRVQSTRQKNAKEFVLSDPELSSGDVLNPTDDDMEPVTITPRKKGMKRQRTSGSKRSIASPLQRKRNRLKSPRKLGGVKDEDPFQSKQASRIAKDVIGRDGNGSAWTSTENSGGESEDEEF